MFAKPNDQTAARATLTEMDSQKSRSGRSLQDTTKVNGRFPGYKASGRGLYDSNGMLQQGSSNSGLTNGSRQPTTSTVVEKTLPLPLEFNAFDTWPHLRGVKHPSLPSPEDDISKEELAKLMAYRCINHRGTIAHGRMTQLSYQMDRVRSSNATSVKEVFDKFGGSKQFIGSYAEEIKREIMTSGPVVSVSFEMSREFLDVTEYDSCFADSCLGDTHEVLIFGWKLTPYGAVWLVKGLHGPTKKDEFIPISFGQFGIDDICLVPKNSFDNHPWQHAKEYVDAHTAERPDWLHWPGMSLFMNDSELKSLGKCIKVGIHRAIQEERSFVVRDVKKIARSRKFIMKEVTYNELSGKWKVDLLRSDKSSKDKTNPTVPEGITTRSNSFTDNNPTIHQ